MKVKVMGHVMWNSDLCLGLRPKAAILTMMLHCFSMAQRPERFQTQFENHQIRCISVAPICPQANISFFSQPQASLGRA